MTIFKKLMSTAFAGVALFASNAYAGYTVTEAGYTGSEITSNMRNTAGSTNVVSGDDVTTTFILPFAFTFYGQNYAAGSQGWVSTNGLLGFDMSNQQSYCCSARTSNVSPTNTIQAAWFDLVGNVSTKTSGAVGGREFLFTWDAVEFGYGTANYLQAILHEGSNNIEFQYRAMGTQHTTNVGGIRGDASTNGMNFIDASTNFTLNNKGLLISAVPEPGSLALLGLGLAGFALSRRKSKPGRNA